MATRSCSTTASWCDSSASRRRSCRSGVTGCGLADGRGAKAALEQIALASGCMLRYGGERTDRYGRLLAQMFSTGTAGDWVQQAMLARAGAGLFASPTTAPVSHELLAAERPRAANGLASGPIPITACGVRTGRRRCCRWRATTNWSRGGCCWPSGGGRVYLNFGRLWKEDFTVVIDGGALKLFGDDGHRSR